MPFALLTRRIRVGNFRYWPLKLSAPREIPSWHPRPPPPGRRCARSRKFSVLVESNVKRYVELRGRAWCSCKLAQLGDVSFCGISVERFSTKEKKGGGASFKEPVEMIQVRSTVTVQDFELREEDFRFACPTSMHRISYRARACYDIDAKRQI